MTAAALAMAEPRAMAALRCGAKTRRRSEPCGRPAGWGTEHVGIGRCKFHGGCTPSHIAHAQAQLATLAPPAVQELQRLLADPNVADETKLRTAVAVLDRVGLSVRNGVGVAIGVTVNLDERKSRLLERAEIVLDGGPVGEMANDSNCDGEMGES